jgi:hypothetical protein
MPFDPPEYMYPQTGMISFLRNNAGSWRIFGNLGGEVCIRFGLHCIEGYDAMYQARYGKFVNAASSGIPKDGARSTVLLDKKGKYSNDLLQLLGVKYFVHRISDGHNIWAYPVWNYDPEVMKSVYKDDYYEIFEYTEAYPRVYLASSYRLVDNDNRNIDVLFDSGTDRQSTLTIERNPDPMPLAGVGIAEILKYRPGEVTVRTKSLVPKLLFLSDVYSSGWQARVDSKPVDILRADFDFRAVALQPGDHEIRFYYQPDGSKKGFVVCMFSLLVITVLSYIQYRYEDRFL